MHHFTTGMATIKTASTHALQLISHFKNYYEKAVQNPAGKYKSFVLGPVSSKKVQALLKLLNKHRIRYGRVQNPGKYKGFSYKTGEVTTFKTHKGDVVVSSYQPHSVLVRVLFQPKPILTDSLTYDISAWALPRAYGLKAFASTQRIEAQRFNIKNIKNTNQNEISGSPYAYLFRWKNPADLKLLADLLKHDITARYAMEEFSINGQSFKPGTIVVPRAAGNGDFAHFDEIIQREAAKYQIKIYPVPTGLTSSGPDLGSSNFRVINAPRVALLSGPGIQATMVGSVWFYFDQTINYPVTLIGTDYFNRVDLHDYDVLVLPSAGFFTDGYSNTLDKKELNKIKKWVSSGGTLIALGSANNFLSGKKGFALQKKKK